MAIELENGGSARRAVAYPALTGRVEAGDDVIVNVEALDLGLGSGGFDILCVNITRGLEADGEDGGAHVMKLNYTPLQHGVNPVEEGLEQLDTALAMPVCVLALHGQLAPAAFALAERSPGHRVGYVQTEGGALPGGLSDTVATLLDRGLLVDHVAVAPCFGARGEAITLEGALHGVREGLDWDAALVGPGPGMLGSASAFGHGGLAALHNAHSALSLGCTVVVAPRVSSGESRERHRGLSHHTRTVLKLLLRPVGVAVSSGLSDGARAELEDAVREAGHEAVEVEVDDLMSPYLGAELPADTMGRTFHEDEDFFRSALAAGATLATRMERSP
jgi:hypothetical protein